MAYYNATQAWPKSNPFSPEYAAAWQEIYQDIMPILLGRLEMYYNSRNHGYYTLETIDTLKDLTIVMMEWLATNDGQTFLYEVANTARKNRDIHIQNEYRRSFGKP